MSTTLSPPTQVSSGVWRYSWTGTAPFTLFDYSTYDFTLQDSDDTEYYASDGGADEPQAIEVFDSTEDSSTANGMLYPAKITLQWRGYAYADYYEIQEETSTPGTYATVQTYAENGSGYYKFTATKLSDDVGTGSYRIITVDKSGAVVNTDFEAVIIRNPDPPELTYTYSAGTGLLTIAAA
jgi:hypothetical protein